MAAKSRVKGGSTIKNVATVVSSLVIIYAAMFSLGVAPITNGRAAEMVTEAVTESNKIVLERIDQIEQKQGEFAIQFAEIITQVGSLKDNTDRIDNNVQRVMELLIQMNGGTTGRPR